MLLMSDRLLCVVVFGFSVACFSSIPAWRPLPESASRRILFKGSPYSDKREPDFYVPCNGCIGCRLDYSREWAIRCSHEASLYDDNCFLTLTYSDVNLPTVGSLVPRDLQLFTKRLRDFSVRTRGRGIRTYGCGEYGEQFARPHYHILVFDFDFKDKKHWRTTDFGHRLYRSETLESLWPYGNCEIGSVSFDSAAYVARYVVKKINGDMASEHYHCVDADGRSHWRVPEFARMSQSIGKRWVDKFHPDIYSFDFVLLNGHKFLPPRAYDKQYEVMFPDDFKRIQKDRSLRFFVDRLERIKESTYQQFAVHTEVANAKLSQSGRKL